MPDRVRHDGLGGFRKSSERRPRVVTLALKPGSSSSVFELASWVS